MTCQSLPFCREIDHQQHLILGNGNIVEVGRLNAKVGHIDRAGGCASGRVPNQLALHIKDFFVSFAMQRQIASNLEVRLLPINVVHRQISCASGDKRRHWILVGFQVVLSDEVIASFRIGLQGAQINADVHRGYQRISTSANLEMTLLGVSRAHSYIVRLIFQNQIFLHMVLA